MNLKLYKDYFKTSFNWNEAISIGKIDNNKDIAICFYNSKRTKDKRNIYGGKSNQKYHIKPITILLRYTKNKDNAETKALEIQEFFNERTFFIDEKRIYSQLIYDDPIDLGSDEDGVYEYSFEIDFIEGGE